MDSLWSERIKMAKISIVADMLDKHTDAEIIEHLYRVMNGVSKNYAISVKEKCPELLWGNLGDIEQVAAILCAMYKRNQERQAQSNMIQ